MVTPSHPSPESLPLYEQILFDKLGIPRNYFENEEHLKGVREKLANAAQGMREGLTEFVGLNVCIHVASSFVLLESSRAKLTTTLDEIAELFPDIDPTTVVTAASLYYILKHLESRGELKPSEKKDIQYMHKRFMDISWLIGTERMKRLGLV
jgi:hypothetical protein